MQTKRAAQRAPPTAQPRCIPPIPFPGGHSVRARHHAHRCGDISHAGLRHQHRHVPRLHPAASIPAGHHKWADPLRKQEGNGVRTGGGSHRFPRPRPHLSPGGNGTCGFRRTRHRGAGAHAGRYHSPAHIRPIRNGFPLPCPSSRRYSHHSSRCPRGSPHAHPRTKQEDEHHCAGLRSRRSWLRRPHHGGR